MAFDKKAYIKNRFDRRVGSPILGHEIEDSELEKAISDICLEYYQACPIKHIVSVTASIGNTDLTVSDVMEDLFGDNDELFYFLGLTRADYLLEGENQNSGYEALLAGVSGGGVNLPSGRSSIVNAYGPHGTIGGISLWEPTSALQGASVRDQVLADLEVQVSEIDDRVRYLTPYAGSISAEFGFGFVGNHTDDDVEDADKKYPWEGVPMNHLSVVSNMVSEELVTAVLSGRAAVRVGQGPELDTAALETIRQELHEQNMNDIAGISTPVAFFG